LLIVVGISFNSVNVRSSKFSYEIFHCCRQYRLLVIKQSLKLRFYLVHTVVVCVSVISAVLKELAVRDISY